MFTDPVSVTYNGSSKSLVRAAGPSRPGVRRELASSRYSTTDSEFELSITQTQMEDDSTRAEVTLTRVTPDPDGPFAGSYSLFPNRVSLVFEVNKLRYGTSTDVPLLQAALLSLVDSTFRGRLIGGEA